MGKKKKLKPSRVQQGIAELHKLKPDSEVLSYLNNLIQRTDNKIDMVVINKALNKIQENFHTKTGNYNMVMVEEQYKEYKDKIVALKKLRAIENALNLLLSLKPLLPDCQEGQKVNEDMERLKPILQDTIRRYIDLFLYDECFDILLKELFPKTYHLHDDNKDLDLMVIRELRKPDVIKQRIRDSQTTKKGYSKKKYGKHGIQRKHGIWDEAIKDIFNEFKLP